MKKKTIKSFIQLFRSYQTKSLLKIGLIKLSLLLFASILVIGLLESNFYLIVDIKSLNGKYFDVIPKISEVLSMHESKIISLVKKECTRGKIFLNVFLKSNQSLNDSDKINKKNFKTYISKVKQLQNALNRGSDDEPTIEHFLKVPEIFEPNDDIDFSKKSKVLFDCVNKAIKQLIKHRQKEGKLIQKDIVSKVKIIKTDIKKIIRLSDTNKDKELKKIRSKINSILTDIVLDENRLYQEIGIILEKKDINEEVSRLNSHIILLEEFISQDENVGKKVNFLLQEMTREINTIGSKVENINIKHRVVDIKNNIEKIREQVQNIL